jgi:hypothetical protein
VQGSSKLAFGATTAALVTLASGGTALVVAHATSGVSSPTSLPGVDLPPDLGSTGGDALVVDHPAGSSPQPVVEPTEKAIRDALAVRPQPGRRTLTAPLVPVAQPKPVPTPARPVLTPPPPVVEPPVVVPPIVSQPTGPRPVVNPPVVVTPPGTGGPAVQVTGTGNAGSEDRTREGRGHSRDHKHGTHGRGHDKDQATGDRSRGRGKHAATGRGKHAR